MLRLQVEGLKVGLMVPRLAAGGCRERDPDGFAGRSGLFGGEPSRSTRWRVGSKGPLFRRGLRRGDTARARVRRPLPRGSRARWRGRGRRVRRRVRPLVHDRGVHRAHTHHLPDEHVHKHALGPFVLGLAVHNLADGFVLGVGAKAGAVTSWLVGLGVLVHQIPVGISSPPSCLLRRSEGQGS